MLVYNFCCSISQARLRGGTGVLRSKSSTSGPTRQDKEPGQRPLRGAGPAFPTDLGLRCPLISCLGQCPQPLCFLLNFRLVALTQDQPPCCSSKRSRSPSSSVPPLLRDTCNPNVLQNHLSFHSQHHDLTVPAH